jgi:hypothetical protein
MVIFFQAKLRAQISLALEEDTTPSTPETPVKLNEDTLISLALINDFLHTSSVFQAEISTLSSNKFQTRTELANIFDLTEIEKDIPILTKILPPHATKAATTDMTIESDDIQRILKDDDTSSV